MTGSWRILCIRIVEWFVHLPQLHEKRELSNTSFKTILESGGPNDYAFAHSIFFSLVNPDEEIEKSMVVCLVTYQALIMKKMV